MADIPRIKGNISKMIAQNAPEADIDAYLASEGVSLADLQAPAAPSPDKYKQAAIDERNLLKSKGVDTGAGLARQILQGVTMGGADEAIAAATAPLEMIKRGILNPAEAYRYTKARENLITDDSRDQNGAVGTAAEILGGAASGSGLARAGISAGRNLAANSGILARTGASLLDGLGFGAVSGALEGDTLGERGMNAIQGGAVGGAVGGAAPSILSMVKSAASPIISNITARVNPEGFAQRQVARALTESGQTPADIGNAVTQAAREGQGMFTIADAMGNAGQRMLSTTARAPGDARTAVVDFLDARQAGQGRRVANALAEGFDSPQTAAQTRTRLTDARDAAADVNYGAARAQTGAVDVTPAIQEIDRTLRPGAMGLMGGTPDLPADSIAATLQRARSLLTNDRSQVSRFDEAFRVKQELDLMIEGAKPTLQRLLIPVRNALDGQLERSSGPYAAARDQFRTESQAINAIDEGRAAALRGRPEDTIPAFQRMRPDQQAAYRTGYVDPLIEQVQTAPAGTNRVRALTSDAFSDEAAAMAPGNDLMQRRLAREDTMFKTRHAAVGNSKTVENAADDAAMGIDPSLVTNLISGNWGGALRNMLSAGQNALSGNTADVRREVARILTQRGANVNTQAVQNMLDDVVQRIETLRQVAQHLGRGVYGGTAVTTQTVAREN
jgi:hypothetical protein